MPQRTKAPAFASSGDAYDAFMGRYSVALAAPFADFTGAVPGVRALDVGCGPGALAAELVRRLGPGAVAACDPSPSLAAACAERHPGVDVRAAAAEELPFPDQSFDLVAAQLVLPFLADPVAAGAEMLRVTRPGGTIGAAVWDLAAGMEMLRAFWDAAVSLDPDAPDELRVSVVGRGGDVGTWLAALGLDEVSEATLVVSSAYSGFDELWSGFRTGIGPPGVYCASLPEDRREALRRALFARVGSPSGPFTLDAVALVGKGTRPS